MDPDAPYRRLRIYNLAMGFLHAAQGVAILVLSNDFSLPVTATFMEGPPGTPLKLTEWFMIPLGPAVAAFLFISAAAHFLIASPGIFGWYRFNLQRGRNYARWIEYSVSASLMIVLIALITGVSDVAALIALFGVNSSMILFGLLMEHYERPGHANWIAFWFGCLVGAVPWLAIAIYLWSPTTAAQPPAFVYAIFVSLFLFFNSFAINMALQYAGVGRWRNYLFGESVYVLLSLVAKSALAWQVFANTLVPQ
jgi:Heliorhodopsin